MPILFKPLVTVALGMSQTTVVRRLKSISKDFQTRDDIKKALEQFFKEQSPAFWSKGIYDLPKRWQKTIDANEAYFK
ncbi:hypothetical protein RB195_013082 [Necator americanus]|uniref:HAT C-terminal dimerisation domain-containing protein n=1 Tax=Necator americanus TaxID=51031 RepID=A0ABR1DU01_NECAM